MTASHLHAYDNGQIALSGPALALYRALDARFCELADACGATEYAFPPALPLGTLARIEYLGSFPHLATFAAAAGRSDDNLREVAAGSARASEVPAEHLEPARDLLTPAACYHVYPRFQHRDLPAPVHVTTNARCFRRETEYRPLERLWSFSMREVVCIGDADAVDAFLDRGRAFVDALTARIGLELEWAQATDPFFDAEADPKHIAQLVAPLKLEMVHDHRLAVGSVNRHGSYFGDAFAIDHRGRPAHSGCVAFGVERWMAAVLDRFGDDPAGWPDALAGARR